MDSQSQAPIKYRSNSIQVLINGLLRKNEETIRATQCLVVPAAAKRTSSVPDLSRTGPDQRFQHNSATFDYRANQLLVPGCPVRGRSSSPKPRTVPYEFPYRQRQSFYGEQNTPDSVTSFLSVPDTANIRTFKSESDLRSINNTNYQECGKTDQFFNYQFRPRADSMTYNYSTTIPDQYSDWSWDPSSVPTSTMGEEQLSALLGPLSNFTVQKQFQPQSPQPQFYENGNKIQFGQENNFANSMPRADLQQPPATFGSNNISTPGDFCMNLQHQQNLNNSLTQTTQISHPSGCADILSELSLENRNMHINFLVSSVMNIPHPTSFPSHGFGPVTIPMKHYEFEPDNTTSDLYFGDVHNKNPTSNNKTMENLNRPAYNHGNCETAGAENTTTNKPENRLQPPRILLTASSFDDCDMGLSPEELDHLNSVEEFIRDELGQNSFCCNFPVFADHSGVNFG